MFIFLIYSFSFSQIYVYWTDATNDNIHRAKLDGTGEEEVLGFQNTPRGITIDYEHGKFYFADGEHDAITSANLDGTDVEYLNYTPEPIDVFYDKSTGYIYYTDVVSETISRIKPDGTDNSVIISNQIKPAFFDIDLVNKKIYYCSRQDTKSVIYKADINGQNIIKVIEESGYITGVAIDPFNEKLYWLNRKTAKLHSSNIDGNNKTDLANAGSACIALELDNINSKLYWAEKDLSRIRSINTDGSNLQTYMEDAEQVGGINFDIKNECRKIKIITDTITVYNTLGQSVLTTHMSSAKKVIDLSTFENGSYWVEVFNNNTIYSKKVVLTK